MQISTKTINIFYFTFVLLVLCYSINTNMMSTEWMVDNARSVGLISAIALFFLILSSFKLILPGYHLYKFATPIIFYALFFIWTEVPTILLLNVPTKELFLDVIWLITPLFVLIVSYNSAYNLGHKKWIMFIFFVMAILIVRQYITLFFSINLLVENSHLTSSYHTLYILPLIFLSKSNKIKIISAIIVTIIIFTSLKRSGVIALMLGLFAYIVIKQLVAERIKKTTIVIGIILLTIFGGLFIYLGTLGENNIFERFENIGNDNGSGRTVVWEVTQKMISKEDALSFFVGNGYNTVRRDSPIFLSAHNDFLEITYDFGLIGLSLYICAILSLVLQLVQMIKSKSEYAPPLGMLFIIYTIFSMISHVAIYYWVNIVMLTFGYILGLYRKDAS